MSKKEMVTISKEEYIQLSEDRAFLAALEAAGVDNWAGYCHAQEILEIWKIIKLKRRTHDRTK